MAFSVALLEARCAWLVMEVTFLLRTQCYIYVTAFVTVA